MSTTITQETPAQPRKPLRKRRWFLVTASATGLAVALSTGVVIGINSQSGQITQERASISSLRGQVSSLNGQVSSLNGQESSLNGQVSAADAKAASAQQAADAKAAQAYKSRNAQLDLREAAVKRQETAIAAEAGQLHASEISDDGVYVVGSDIQPGTWHTAGDSGGSCYYALLSSTNTDAIIDNNNITGPATVDLNGARAFEISGGCTWARVSG
jgi:TolA-binding protein